MKLEQLTGLGMKEGTAQKVIDSFNNTRPQKGAEECWKELTTDILGPDEPAEALVRIFMEVYDQDDRFSDAPKAWIPSNETVEGSNIQNLCRETSHNDLNDLFEWSIKDRASFWGTITDKLGIEFLEEPRKTVDLPDGLESPAWFPGAKLNIADSCFKAPSDRAAIVFKRENQALEEWSYEKLNNEVLRVANGLNDIGFKKGDKAAIDMPMTAEAVAIYLGVVKAGGSVVSIADSLAPAEVEKRLGIVGTDLLFTQDVIVRGGKELPLYNKLMEKEMPPTIVLPGKDDHISVDIRDDDYTWHDFLGSNKAFDSVPCEPDDLCNILFSSGTTSDPKAIPWTHTTPIKSASDGYLHHDIKEKEVVAWPTNIGWMMGPWLIFASLINKATIALYYGAPVGEDFGKFIQDAKVNMLGVIPSMVKNWIQTDCMKGLDWSSIKVFSSTGEASNPQDYLWLMARAGFKPVVEYCGGTEIGGGYVSGTLAEPASPSSFTRPCFGLDMVLMDEEGTPAKEGEVFLVPPSIGFSNTLLNKDHHKTYYQGVPSPDPATKGLSGVPLKDQTEKLGKGPILRRHGDQMRILENGFIRPHGRADDTMNLGGIKTSSVEIEQILDVTEGVLETAAIAVDPPEGGPSQLIIYAVLKEGQDFREEDLKSSFQRSIKEELNPLFKIHDIVLTDKLPRTASNKIMRRVLRKRYQEGEKA